MTEQTLEEGSASPKSLLVRNFRSRSNWSGEKLSKRANRASIRWQAKSAVAPLLQGQPAPAHVPKAVFAVFATIEAQ